MCKRRTTCLVLSINNIEYPLLRMYGPKLKNGSCTINDVPSTIQISTSARNAILCIYSIFSILILHNSIMGVFAKKVIHKKILRLILLFVTKEINLDAEKLRHSLKRKCILDLKYWDHGFSEYFRFFIYME